MTSHSKKSVSSDVYVAVRTKEDAYIFYGITTLPDRVMMEYPPHSGQVVHGDIFAPKVLEWVQERINNTAILGDSMSAYRTVSLFHDRVYEKNMQLEEAGFIQPTARVITHPEFKGHKALELDVEINEMYVPNPKYPDYTPEKIKYKIDKKAIGLSIEYLDADKEYKVLEIDGKKYRYVDEIKELWGFGFARANVIGNPSATVIGKTAIAIKELSHSSTSAYEVKKNNEVNAMATEEQMNSLQEQLEKQQAKLKEYEGRFEDLAKAKSPSDASTKEVYAKMAEQAASVKELKETLSTMQNEASASIKEVISEQFEKFKMNKGTLTNEGAENAGVKEYLASLSAGVKEQKWNQFHVQNDRMLDSKVKDLQTMFKEGFNWADNQTLRVKCQGRNMVVVDTARTKDILSSGDMATSYDQAGAMFADRYVPGITETFLKDDTLLRALVKEQHIGGNTKYQWRIWTDFIDASTESLAVDPDDVAIQRNFSKFIKLETPLKEYREGVEITDFTIYHSAAEIGELMEQQINRHAERITQSMAADIFKEEADGDGIQFMGLKAVANSGNNTTLYGLTRSVANRLAPDAAGDTYDNTSHTSGLTIALARAAYEKVLAQGSNFADIAIVTNPRHVTQLYNDSDTRVRHEAMGTGAFPGFGFRREVIPTLDGAPIIRDYNCPLGDMYIVDMSREGAVLVVSKALGVRGLSKIAASESAYVNFYGAFVYKRPRNVFMYDNIGTA